MTAWGDTDDDDDDDDDDDEEEEQDLKLQTLETKAKKVSRTRSHLLSRFFKVG